ncbi:hypothetical protein GCM10027277_47040 [Pseudoduganella ginsengisoli]|uniref:DUF4266 domain-containing protein n=1 Tax=Pseudoduganella ginsengisoli TaxID=1462440 RepID=A0A6L6Q3T6_9BURK|nr:DUF4266 domain-containing protein [Pseudoduganella ginsengisoli]MTW04109.1 DUF4266 domain-containing protein [Pseudoduganella ginsengisoli]
MYNTGKAALAAGIIAVLLSGCGAAEFVKPVAPWEKGMLAQPNMRFERDRNEARYAAHMYDSREAASGAGSVGGGGCGCN